MITINLKNEFNFLSRADDVKNIRSLKNVADIDEVDSRGYTRLYAAIRDENAAVFKALMNYGADIKKMSFTHINQLTAHAANTSVEALNLVLDNKALINHADSDNQTPLFIAAKFGALASVDVLIKRGATINHRDRNGNTPLMAAASYGASKTVRLLLEKGADHSLVDNNGYTALTIANIYSCFDASNIISAHIKKLDSEKEYDHLTAALADVSGDPDTRTTLSNNNTRIRL